MMFIRRCFRRKNGKRHAYWALVESYRTDRGPRQRVVSWLGLMPEGKRLGVAAAAQNGKHQYRFGEPDPEYVRINPKSIKVERVREFGGPWLGLELIRKLGLDELLNKVMEPGREEVPWPLMSMVLVLSRLCDPSSELYIAEHSFGRGAIPDLLGIPASKVNDDRLYRALDHLLPHKEALEQHIKKRMGELFKIEYDLFLYDVTSTYFEGMCEANPLAQRGYSRDQRSGCKQVCIALVVSRCGLPIGYEVFAGNRADVTTVEEIVTTMESRHGEAKCVWVMDRGMTSQKNVEFLQKGGRRYILGTPKAMLKKYEKDLAQGDWNLVHKGLEVKKLGAAEGSQEVFILCRSADRSQKEKAMHEKFAGKVKEGLEKLSTACTKKKMPVATVAQRLGRLLEKNWRAAKAFKTEVKLDADGGARLEWSEQKEWSEWASLSEGCYLLRSNVTDWSGEQLWKAYTQLTEAENAFRIQKSDLELRPVWHQKEERVRAHILVCFVAYVLWKTLGRWCSQAGLGDEPRKVLDELSRLRLVDVVMKTDTGTELRRRCVGQPDEHQAILLYRLGLTLPQGLEVTPDPDANVVET